MARRVNLIPRSERPRTRTDWGLLAMAGLFIVVIFGLGFGYYIFSNMLDERKQELTDIQARIAAVQEQVLALAQYEQLAAQTEDVQAVVQGIYSGRTLLSDVLDALSLVVPENAWFQNLTVTATDPGQDLEAANAGPSDAKISIEGQTYSFEDVSRLIARLQLIPLLTDVTLTSADQDREGTDGELEIKGFTIGASVVNTEPPGALPLTDVEVQEQ